MLDDVVHIFPLISAAFWAVVGVGAFARYSVESPFVRALTVFCFLVSATCFVDWCLLTLVGGNDANLAIALANTRTTLLTLAALVILLASKWISRGHSRYDFLLAVPTAGAIAVIWGGMTTGSSPASWGPMLGRDPGLYLVYAIQQVVYFGAAMVFALSLVRGRRDLPPRLRRPALLSIGSLLVFVILWLITNVYVTLSQVRIPPLFSSVAFIPALLDAAAFMPLSKEELGQVFLAVSDVPRRASALYVFYKTGEPLVAVGTARTLPIEAEQLEGVLDIVGNFVETSFKQFRRYSVTAMNFDRLGIVAVRGQYIIVATVYEGPAYDAIRSELLRTMRDFEERHWQELSTWEGASRIAEEVADDLSRLLRRPGGPEPAEPSEARIAGGP